LQGERYRLGEGLAGYWRRRGHRVARGAALLRVLTDKTGLTGGLSRALATDRLLTHDRRRVLADLAWLESGD
jgi:hypothetical protein